MCELVKYNNIRIFIVHETCIKRMKLVSPIYKWVTPKNNCTQNYCYNGLAKYLFSNNLFISIQINHKRSIKPYLTWSIFRIQCDFEMVCFIEIHRTSHLNIGSNRLLACYWHLHRPSTSPQRDLDFSLRQEIVLTRHMPENLDEIISNCYIGPY